MNWPVEITDEADDHEPATLPPELSRIVDVLRGWARAAWERLLRVGRSIATDRGNAADWVARHIAAIPQFASSDDVMERRRKFFWSFFVVLHVLVIIAVWIANGCRLTIPARI
jgi:hypothetical protein